MIKNRSVPTETILPHLAYQNIEEAMEWLTRVFGFSEHYRYGEPGAASGAQMHLGEAWIMLERAREGRVSPVQAGACTQNLTVFVGDVDAHFQKAKAQGAQIFEEVHETVYGERQYGAVDLDGHRWLFSRHSRDVSPTEWGAQIPRG
jgi:uncharacterized glyoxalase superfamily protein PhnB